MTRYADGMRRKAAAANRPSVGTMVAAVCPRPSMIRTRAARAATANTYFTCTIAPEDAGAGSAARSLAVVTAVDLDASSETPGLSLVSG